jgi:FkbM family methyltransferase
MEWIVKHLKQKQLNLPKHVIHVGGYDGHENQFYQRWGSKSTWFEPLPDKFEELKLKGFNVFNFALGSETKKVKFYVSSNGQSSSVLEPTNHLNIYPQFKFEQTIDVDVKTLDSFNILDCDMLVLDTQGYELEVLKGSKNTLQMINFIVCEVFTKELYKNSPLLKDIQDFLSDYELVDIDWVEGSEKYWGDALFIKKI